MAAKKDQHHCVPEHIAVIMDGNGRWAKKRLLPRTMGHRAAVKRVKELVRSAAEVGVGVLTLFAFSSENWSRPKEEVSILMTLFAEALRNEVAELHQEHVKVQFVGELSALVPALQQAMTDAEVLTQNNNGLQLNIAINYGGYWDLVSAAKKIAQAVHVNQLTIDEINQAKLHDALPSASIPAVDLMIRTSGEQRISNFMLWQLAYAELYFTDKHFPDFDKKALAHAVEWYAARERRFGKTSEQIK